jgi:hypothetical protein
MGRYDSGPAAAWRSSNMVTPGTLLGLTYTVGGYNGAKWVRLDFGSGSPRILLVVTPSLRSRLEPRSDLRESHF